MIKTQAPSGHILTYSGKFVNPLDISSEDIEIVDIGHALSNLCRYNGHVSQFYSVAQHSLLVADQFDDIDLRKWALLHDASEAYLGDVVAPLKYCGEYDFYLEAEERLMQVVVERFSLTPNEMPEVIDLADKALRGPEMRDLKNYMPQNLNGNSATIYGWAPEKARYEFLWEASLLGLE